MLTMSAAQPAAATIAAICLIICTSKRRRLEITHCINGHQHLIRVLWTALIALRRRCRGIAVDGFRRCEGFSYPSATRYWYVRHRPLRNAFPVRVEIKILRHAVPLHIGKHLMPEMGGGLIRAYRRAATLRGTTGLMLPAADYL